MYIPHPSRELNDLFVGKPYQGVSPDKASFLFVGLDANYEERIENKSIFPKIREYHADGVTFWHKINVHHPFLLPEYSGDGQFYHRSFARIGFKSEHASKVSFVELLDVPTVGRSVLEVADLNIKHLKKLNAAILEGQAKHIFLPSAVATLMRATREFSWLGKASQGNINSLGILYRSAQKIVYSHLHFSVYGKFQQKKIQQASDIYELLLESESH